MVFVPSIKVQERLKIEQAGAWLDRTDSAPSFVMIAKIPMNVIRAINVGAKLWLSCWLVDLDGRRMAAFGLQVDDHPEYPAVLFGPCRDNDELQLLETVLRTTDTFPVQVHNETFIPVLRLGVRFDEPSSGEPREALATRISSAEPHDVETRSQALEIIQASQSAGATKDPRIRMTCHQGLHIEEKQLIRSYVAGVGEFSLDDLNQGGELERLSLQAFDHLCPFGAYHQPLVQTGSKRRELCDVLALSRIRESPNEGIFVVECKVLTSDENTLSRMDRRRASNVEKQILSAMDQLCGAIKRLKRGDSILRSDGTPIEDDAPETKDLVEPMLIQERACKVGHGIVVVSDMHPGADWTAIADKMLESCKATGYMFHVLDLRELQRMVSYSKDRPAGLEALLVLRWKEVVKRGSAFVRVKFV